MPFPLTLSGARKQNYAFGQLSGIFVNTGLLCCAALVVVKLISIKTWQALPGSSWQMLKNGCKYLFKHQKVVIPVPDFNQGNLQFSTLDIHIITVETVRNSVRMICTKYYSTCLLVLFFWRSVFGLFSSWRMRLWVSYIITIDSQINGNFGMVRLIHIEILLLVSLGKVVGIQIQTILLWRIVSCQHNSPKYL